jgi:3-oxoacyl-[acyl-carrier protein] reductase
MCCRTERVAGQEAKAVVDQIRAAGGRADAIAADLAAPDGAHVLDARVRHLIGDRLDFLVLNAGISNASTFETMTVWDFDYMFAVNVRAPYFLVQQLLPTWEMAATSCSCPRLVRVRRSERCRLMPAPKVPSNMLVKYLAAALGARGIRVNAVAPYVTDADMSNFTKTEEGRTVVKGMQALKRIGRADDVAEVIAFLVSDKRAGSPAMSLPPTAARSSEPAGGADWISRAGGGSHRCCRRLRCGRYRHGPLAREQAHSL